MNGRASLILALDTSGTEAGIALAGDGRIDVRLLPLRDRGVARTEDLATETAALLAARGRTARELTLFAAVVGPGSYTGLRSGLAFLRGLAFGDSTPAVAVGTLELLAWRAALPGETVVAAAPAGSGRYVAGSYARDDDTVSAQTAPQILEAPDFADFFIAARGAGSAALICHAPPAPEAPSDDAASARGEPHHAWKLLESAAVAAGLELRAPGEHALEQLVRLAELKASHAQVLRVEELLPVYVGQASARPNRHRVAVAEAPK